MIWQSIQIPLAHTYPHFFLLSHNQSIKNKTTHVRKAQGHNVQKDGEERERNMRKRGQNVQSDRMEGKETYGDVRIDSLRWVLYANKPTTEPLSRVVTCTETTEDPT